MSHRALDFRVGVALVAAAAGLYAHPLQATPCSHPGAAWCDDGWSASLAAPVGLTSLGIDKVWVSGSSSVMAFHSGTGVVEFQGEVGTVSGRAMPIVFGENSHALFVTGQDGYLYRRDASTGACIWKTYLGRTTATDITPGCNGEVIETCPNDSLTSMPAIRFGANEAQALVFVGTRYIAGGAAGCSDLETENNRVYAISAATGEPVWIFNHPKISVNKPYADVAGNHAMDFVSGAVMPDVWDDGCGEAGVRDQLYFGSNSQAGQDTLWAVDALTGTLLWSADVGGVQTTPILSFNGARCERLYVGTLSKKVQAIGITNTACSGPPPCEIWSAEHGSEVLIELAVPQFGAEKGHVFASGTVDVRSYLDKGTTASVECVFTPSTKGIVTQPVAFGGKVYVGSNLDIWEFSALDCSGEKSRTLGSAGFLSHPSIDATPDFKETWAVFGTSAGQVMRFDLPF